MENILPITILALVLTLGAVIAWDKTQPNHTLYEIVIENHPEVMQATVERMLRDGWRLHGPTELQIMPGGNALVVQPMVK